MSRVIMRALEAIERFAERILAVVISAVVGAVVRLLRRGRHRNWRRGLSA